MNSELERIKQGCPFDETRKDDALVWYQRTSVYLIGYIESFLSSSTHNDHQIDASIKKHKIAALTGKLHACPICENAQTSDEVCSSCKEKHDKAANAKIDDELRLQFALAVVDETRWKTVIDFKQSATVIFNIADALVAEYKSRKESKDAKI